MKKIIGIDASRASKYQKTGTEWYAYHVIQELKKIIPVEYEVRLYSQKPLVGELGQLPENWKNVVLNWYGYLWTTIRLSIEMVISPPDVLWLPCSGLPLFLSKKTVNTIHDIGFDRFPKAYPARRRLFHRFYIKQALRRCSALLAVSQFTKRELIKLYHARPDKITTSPLAADDNFYVRSTQECEKVLKKYSITQPYILYVGRVEHKKNIPRLLTAFDAVHIDNPYLQLVIAGPKGDAEGLVDSALKKSPLNIKRLNWVKSDEIPFLFAGAHVFLFPTLYEGFGIPILESMASGTPVLTSKGGAHEEVSGDAAILVDSVSSESIAIGLRKLVNDEGLRVGLRKLGLERAKKYSWQKTAEITWTVLESQI